MQKDFHWSSAPCSFSRMLPFQELSFIKVAEREKISVAWGSRSWRCLWSKATLLEFCRNMRITMILNSQWHNFSNMLVIWWLFMCCQRNFSLWFETSRNYMCTKLWFTNMYSHWNSFILPRTDSKTKKTVQHGVTLIQALVIKTFFLSK